MKNVKSGSLRVTTHSNPPTPPPPAPPTNEKRREGASTKGWHESWYVTSLLIYAIYESSCTFREGGGLVSVNKVQRTIVHFCVLAIRSNLFAVKCMNSSVYCVLKGLRKLTNDFWWQATRTLPLDVQVALANLDFAVYSVSNYICRHCLGVLKKRQNLKQNLKQLEESMRKEYAASSGKAGLPFKPKELQ